MRTPLAFCLLSLAFFSCSTPQGPATKLEKAAVLPLEINDKFQFRKIKQDFFNADPVPVTTSEPVVSSAQRLTWGAVGHYQARTALRELLLLFLAHRGAGGHHRPAGIPSSRPEQLCHGHGTLLSAGERLLQIGLYTAGDEYLEVRPGHFLAGSSDRRRPNRGVEAVVYVAVTRGRDLTAIGGLG